jgi:hypothetical protein
VPGRLSTFLVLTRIGFAARGIMYLLVAYMALWLGRAADIEGVLEHLNSGTGRALLAPMAVGFAGYGVWRLVDAALDLDGQGGDAKGVAIRLAHTGSGFIHLWLAWEASEIVLGSPPDPDGRETAEAGAATAMSLPGGGLLLLTAAALLVAVGAFQLVHAAKRRFRRHLAAAAAREGWVTLAGVLGYAARGAVFVVAAWLLFRAWNASSPDAAGGLGDALNLLSAPLRTGVAAGLAAFGAFSLVEAWYRVLPEPHVGRRVKQAVS